MSRSFLTPINLNQLELENLRLENLGESPESPLPGQIYFQTTSNLIMFWNGVSWVGSNQVSADVEAQINLMAPLASPLFTGIPRAPTATAGTDTTQIATTAFVAAIVALLTATITDLYAPIDTPVFTGNVTIPAGTMDATIIGGNTPAAGTFTTLNITSLPTSSDGLPAGAVWNDGGVLAIS